MTLALAALTGIALTACAGLRFFDWPLASSMAWLAADAALATFGVASAVEVLADKVPALDHALDAAQSFLAPVAGAMVAVSVA